MVIWNGASSGKGRPRGGAARESRDQTKAPLKRHRVVLEQDPVTRAVHIRSEYGTDIVIEYEELANCKDQEELTKFLHSRASVVSKLMNKEPS